MKHGRIFPIWAGLFLILCGLAFIVEAIIGIHIPVGRISLGILLCYAGYYCIAGWKNRRKTRYSCNMCHTYANATMMESSTIELNEDTFKNQEPFEYATTMGSTIIDMTRIYPTGDLPKSKHTIRLDTTLGQTTLKINKSYTFCIHTHGALSQITFPEGHKVTAQAHVFYWPNDCSSPDLEIYAHTVLGSLEIVIV